MKFILLMMMSLQTVANEMSNCTKKENGSLWIEEYDCDKEVNVQIGHEIINNSLVINKRGQTTQYYENKNQEKNLEFFEKINNLKNKD